MTYPIFVRRDADHQENTAEEHSTRNVVIIPMATIVGLFFAGCYVVVNLYGDYVDPI